MNRLTDRPPLSRADKLCAALLVGAFLAPQLSCWAMDTAAIRSADVEVDKPPAITITAPTIDFVPLLEALEDRREELYWEAVPLDQECRDALQEACAVYGVPICLALGLIETESGFQADAISGEGCIGLMQTNAKYADTFEKNTGHSIYTPDGNIYCGVWYLAKLIEQYGGDQLAALTAYNKGVYTGTVSRYAKNVMKASEKWGVG